MVKILRSCLVLYAIAALSGQTTLLPVPAQASERWSSLITPTFETASRREGLPHPVITSVVQDKSGFIWVGTQGGLARYDGFRFQTYKADSTNPSALPDAYIMALHVTEEGRLWIGTAGGGAVWYDPVRDAFVRAATGSAGTPDLVITGIADDGQGGVWIASRNGITHIPRSGPAHRFAVDTGDLPNNQLTSILRGDDGVLWAGTMAGLVRLMPGEHRFDPVPLGSNGTSRVLHEDEDGRIWMVAPVGDNDQLFVTGDTGTNVPHPALDGRGQPLLFPRGWVVDLATDRAGHAWVALQRGGVIEVDLRDGGRQPLLHDPADPASLPDNTVYGLYGDGTPYLWIATRAGLVRFSPSNRWLASIRYSPLHPERLSGPDALVLHTTADGLVLAGLLKGGIDILDPERGRVGRYIAGENGLPEAAIVALETIGEQLYVGSDRGLLRITGRQAATPIPLPGPDQLAQALLSWRGRLWIGTRTTLSWLDPRTGTVTPFQCGSTPYVQNVINLRAGPDGRLWLGTPGGIEAIDIDGCRIETFRNDPKDPASTPSGIISGLMFDSRGRLWAGTMGSGIGVATLDQGRPRFRVLSTGDGLPNSNIGAMVEGRDGRVWVSTADGIAAVTPDLRISAYGAAEGLSIPAYWVRSGTLTPAGDVAFGGGGGITVVRADANPGTNQDLPVVVTALRIGNSSIPAGSLDLTHRGRPLVLPSGGTSLQVEFSALDYGAPERTRYRYRLDGFEQHWTETDPTRRVATYTNLPPGDFTLRIDGAGRGGDWSSRGLAIPVHVEPAWHQTTTFHLAALLAACGGIIGLVQIRTRLIRHRQQQLEQEVAERTRDLVEANHKLETLASTDPLTGALNRRRFLEALEAEVERAQRYGHSLALLEIDLDHFKQVNDRYGHAGGDAALCQSVTRISALLRSVDHLGRLGGEEFAVLLPVTGLDGAQQVAARIREALMATPIPYADHAIPITASIGCAEWLQWGETADALLLRADQALYAAKLLGRNRVEAWTPAVAGRFNAASST